jgi:hypothetical protein
MDFIMFYNESKIILAVFPPHATHKLQPLDVVLYGSLSGAYSQELTAYLHNSQGLLTVKKEDLFPLFGLPGHCHSQLQTYSQVSRTLGSFLWTQT